MSFDRITTNTAAEMERLERRFWSKVDRSGGPDACWPWIASRLVDGYGQFFCCGTMRRAHRIAWMLFAGVLPEELCVLHRCDNPPCVNPAHLFLGTVVENNSDMTRKGRGVFLFGSANGSALLTEDVVLDIRREWATGISPRRIAARRGIGYTTVYDIVRGRRWGHLPLSTRRGA